jgi:hypothetical protein
MPSPVSIDRPRKLTSFREAYDFAYGTYSRSTREKLFEFLAAVPGFDIKTHENTPQIELAEMYSFMLADSIVQTARISDDDGKKAVHGELQRNRRGAERVALAGTPSRLERRKDTLARLLAIASFSAANGKRFTISYWNIL